MKKMSKGKLGKAVSKFLRTSGRGLRSYSRRARSTLRRRGKR